MLCLILLLMLTYSDDVYDLLFAFMLVSAFFVSRVACSPAVCTRSKRSIDD